jgi:uncharacterized repeat protein (TIGR03803 family)
MASSLAAFGQTFKTLVNFSGPDGATPQIITLAQGRDGNLWGTTELGGNLGFGTAFRMTPSGMLNYVSFNSIDRLNPAAGVALGRDNYFYGVTMGGGANGNGVVFKLSTTGALTVLASFGAQGRQPTGTLALGADRNGYGTLSYGGSNNCASFGCGSLFKVTPSGALTTLYTFVDGLDGAVPVAGLVQATDGNFYGTAAFGGGSTHCTATPAAERFSGSLLPEPSV